jgi:hypothetical protein
MFEGYETIIVESPRFRRLKNITKRSEFAENLQQE